jgi:hypothetical protein
MGQKNSYFPKVKTKINISPSMSFNDEGMIDFMDDEIEYSIIVIIGKYKQGKSWITKNLLQLLEIPSSDVLCNNFHTKAADFYKFNTAIGHYCIVDLEGFDKMEQKSDTEQKMIINNFELINFVMSLVTASPSLILYVCNKWSITDHALMERMTIVSTRSKFIIINNDFNLSIKYKEDMLRHYTELKTVTFSRGDQPQCYINNKCVDLLFLVAHNDSGSIRSNTKVFQTIYNMTIGQHKMKMGQYLSRLESVHRKIRNNHFEIEYQGQHGQFSVFYYQLHKDETQTKLLLPKSTIERWLKSSKKPIDETLVLDEERKENLIIVSNLRVIRISGPNFLYDKIRLIKEKGDQTVYIEVHSLDKEPMKYKLWIPEILMNYELGEWKIINGYNCEFVVFIN